MGHARIDRDGYLIEYVTEPYEGKPLTAPIHKGRGFHRPRWNGAAWEESDHAAAAAAKAESDAIGARQWRNAELSRADIEVNKAEDGGQSAHQWRLYRIDLRDWPTVEGWPHCARPVAPGGA